MPTTSFSTAAFFSEDHSRTLFPLETNRLIVLHGETELKALIAKCLDDKEQAISFLPQQRVHATKAAGHLRRTVKLDPVAEYFIYDLAYRNRARFRNSHSTSRSHFGYRFEAGQPVSAAASYEAFRKAIAKYSKEYKYSLTFDVSSYFNSVYHHDLVAWLDTAGGSAKDVESFGQFLREINSGRTVDCLPQGIYPAKMIGNDFLRFIDDSHRLKCPQLLRFMDDFYIFSNLDSDISHDFSIIQQMLGEKGLNVNPKKTLKGDSSHVRVQSEIDQIKRNLLKRRRLVITKGYDDDAETITKLFKTPLNNEELSYIESTLSSDDISEEDAELVLTLMRNHTQRVESRLGHIISAFPHLSKNVYIFSGGVSDPNSISAIILEACKDQSAGEYQLFWMAKILEDYLMDTAPAPAILASIMDHPNSTPITKAKILEIADNRYGLPELRNTYLRTGEASWLSWSAAIGSRALNPLSRNHLLTYFGKSSPMNQLIYTVVKRLPSPSVEGEAKAAPPVAPKPRVSKKIK